MRIASFRVQNYKCFVDTGEIKLTPGFNVFIGRNDAGKSALMEALSLRHTHNPHRSLETVRTPTSEPPSSAPTSVAYDLSPEELRQHLTALASFFLPTGPNASASVFATFRSLLETGDRFNADWANGVVVKADLAGLGGLRRDANRYASVLNLAHPSDVQLALQNEITGSYSSYGVVLANWLRDKAYAFRAERLGLGRCAAGPDKVLSPNAQNLAAVLNVLSSSNPARYKRLVEHVRIVFPHISGITSVIVEGSSVEARVWSIPLESERSDLSVPLNQSGTGIGQVLAILYVVVTSDLPSVILIDEPQSFLHPGAVRKLLEILRSYSQHQYIITTHSPTLITLTENDQLFAVRRQEGTNVSTVALIDPNRQDDLRMSLADVGVRLGDVFGADAILWVEGKTEETCFPELLRQLTKTPLHGVQILGVDSTDELGAKNAQRVFEIYSRLAGTASLLPPAVAFILDKEQRSETEIANIERMGRGMVRWLPFRMYENYLLQSACIANLLNAEDASSGKAVSSEDVQAWMERHGGEKKYFAPREPTAYSDADWPQHVHGAKLLHDLFNEFTDARVSYDKVKHGVLLTRQLLPNPSGALSELCKILDELIRGAPSYTE
ncbi:AAA family ATPase [Trinickia violacea]|nr:ATP-binding protein [Trinickia violacea]